jgi:hypothetical protein
VDEVTANDGAAGGAEVSGDAVTDGISLTDGVCRFHLCLCCGRL